jgi:hypothetical protein
MGLKAVLTASAVVSSLMFPSAASAYVLRSDPGRRGCEGDGSACHVFCDNGQLAGDMYFNGTVWSDGVRRDENREVVAMAIRDASGTACT